MSIDVLCLGGTSIDLIQNPKNISIIFRASVGGSVTNTAIICAKLGLKTAMLSRIGKDPLGDFAVRFLGSCGVATSGIAQDPNIRTPIAIANIDKRGNSKYTFYKNTSLESIVCLKDALKKPLNNCKILHFGSSFSFQKESSIEALKYVKYLKKRRVFISFDPNLRPYTIKDKKGARKRVLGLLKWVDLVKISDLDLEFLTGQKDPKKGLKRLKKLTNCETILTLGAKGSVRMDNHGNFTKAPAFKVKIADTIGAGDAFTAGLLYRLNKIGKRRFFGNIKTHLIFASAVSAIICTKQGANKGLKNIKQVKTFLAKHRSR
ncbi:carbohydrate kinase [Candidatus Omnitrophota bacterium]